MFYKENNGPTQSFCPSKDHSGILLGPQGYEQVKGALESLGGPMDIYENLMGLSGNQ